jgi:hypothetical protein
MVSTPSPRIIPEWFSFEQAVYIQKVVSCNRMWLWLAGIVGHVYLPNDEPMLRIQEGFTVKIRGGVADERLPLDDVYYPDCLRVLESQFFLIL